MRNYPTVILDKSTLKSINAEEIKVLQQHYTIIVPQILVNEILGELSHEKEDLNILKKNIKRLAEKLSYHDTIFYPDAQLIAMNELITGQTLPLDGKPIFFNARNILAKDGSQGIYIEEQEELKIFRRWKAGDFTVEDIKHSSNFFHSVRNADLNEFKKKINFDTSIFDEKTSVKQICEVAKKAFSHGNKNFSEEVLNYLFVSFNFSEKDKEKVLYRFKNFTGKSLEEFSPYASYFFLVSSTFATGLKAGAISTSKHKKAHLDIEYFLYLPFVNCISSYDKDFIKYFNAFYRAGQVYFDGDELRKEINLIKTDLAKVRKNKNSVAKLAHNNFNSKSYKLWFNRYIPTEFKENLAKKLSPEEQKKIFEKIMKPINEGVDLHTREPLNKKYANQYNDWDLKKRFGEILIKAKEIFEFNRGWSHIKKNGSSAESVGPWRLNQPSKLVI